MTTHKLLLLPGDGIGPEAMAEVEAIIAFMNETDLASFEVERDLVGGAAYDAHGSAISEDAMARALSADAVLFGAVGGPKWDGVPYEVRPEAGLLRLRKDLGLSPTCVPPSAIRPSPMRHRSSARWWRGSTSSSCAS